MKWIYLPWKYRSADTATKICNITLYVIGCGMIISALFMGYQMVRNHDLGTQVQHEQATRATKEVPITVDHRQYDYIYHTDTKPYNSMISTINDVIKTAAHHDLSSYTDRVYWLKNHMSGDALDSDSNPLLDPKLDLKHGFIGLNTTDQDEKNIRFIVSGKYVNGEDIGVNSSSPALLVGTFDGTTQKITNIQKTNE